MTKGERIYQLRHKLDLTQAQFAVKIGMTKSGISLIEKGRNQLSDPVLLSICYVFHVNETWLRTGEGEMFTITEDEIMALCAKYGLPSAAEEVIREFSRLPPDLQDATLSYVRSVAKAIAEETEEKGTLS